MANVKITELTALTDPASSDVLPIVDVGADTTKKVTIADLLENAGDGAAATPAFSFDNDKNTGIYRPGADQLALVTGGTARLTVSTSAVTSALPVDVLLGSASTPSFTFTGDLNTGIYSPGADQVAISTNGTGRVFIDSSGNVGIGTTTPGANLDVASSTGGVIRLTSTNTSAGANENIGKIEYYTMDADGAHVGAYVQAIQDPADAFGRATALTFGTNDIGGSATEKLRIDRLGNVGIGTTSPNTPLGIVSDSSAVALTIHNRTANDYGYLRFQNNAGTETQAYIGCERTGTNAGNLLFETAGSEAARIDSSRRLLVGTSSSLNTAYKLQIAGETDAVANVACFRGNATGQALLALTKSRTGTIGNHVIVQDDDNIGGIQFRASDGTNYITGASIETEVDGTPGTNDMPSRLVFSTTADGASSPTERMRINNLGGQSWYTDSSSTNGGALIYSGISAGTTYNFLEGRAGATAPLTGGTATFWIRTNGNIQNTNNSYTAISDAKLKENISDAGSQWNDLKALQVRNYNFKPETGYNAHTQIGLIAQEVETVSPGLVIESPDRDEEGNDLGTVTKSVNYSVLYMKAVKALQEAMERIETLETSNADLLARVAALEAN